MQTQAPSLNAIHIYILMLSMFPKAGPWHVLNNLEYDCWPLSQPNEFNMIDCGGLEMAWFKRPPGTVISGNVFEVVYEVDAPDSFYEWGVSNKIFPNRTVSQAKHFCEEQECPAPWKDATEINCCIHHANIHSCPLSFMVHGGICGPWIPDDGQIFTHTLSEAGTMKRQNWSAQVTLVHEGVTDLIAHVRVGHMQAALVATTTVLPATVCGDATCDAVESCSTCPADCGDCPMATSIKVAIGLPISLVVFTFIVTIAWFQYHKQKMFWDESWVVCLKDLKMGQLQGFGNSVVSLQESPCDMNSSRMSGLSVSSTTPNHAPKQHFTSTVIMHVTPQMFALTSSHRRCRLFAAGRRARGIAKRTQRDATRVSASACHLLKALTERHRQIDNDTAHREGSTFKSQEYWELVSSAKRINESNARSVRLMSQSRFTFANWHRACLFFSSRVVCFFFDFRNGRTVALKKIEKKAFNLTKVIRREVKQVRELEYANLCKFIGGTVEVPNVAILTEYCPKGSLQDVLLNDDIPLNWGFRFSFATDIARGMAFLHSHRLFHGRLKSTNCVIDDRWVCKIADYGLEEYRKDDLAEYATTHKPKSWVYLPPECIISKNTEPAPTTDVYSYGVILVEIATRQTPTPTEIDIATDALSWQPSIPELTTTKSENDCPSPAQYIELIQKCWTHNPLLRPTFEQIKKSLHKMNPNKFSPVDMMMSLMEKYSKHLESVVAERTQDLVLEKQKTDRLLYSMLPKQIADDLRQGRVTKAQSYASATVFFSDIVGFTQLSSSSTPYEVVDFLNKLYTSFDGIIDNYDVYKVETIGDAYMVVSGVPNENHNQHAVETANMALDLVNVCQAFVIPHKPEMQLKIRAGIHTGPVVAGVVGTKMPRYCLFGDTVNTASRMESTSEALKIQCSPSTSSILQQIGSYLLSCRGTVTVKGKGEMITWWLEGRDTNTKK
ncbi:atrial natriuretic peptide receptor 1-like [Lampetra planeri]